ncbi:unnamed protein product, partial [Iphiclides podalirius]
MSSVLLTDAKRAVKLHRVRAPFLRAANYRCVTSLDRDSSTVGAASDAKTTLQIGRSHVAKHRRGRPSGPGAVAGIWRRVRFWVISRVKMAARRCQ